MTASRIPPELAAIQEDFLALESTNDRLQFLLELANELPELPERYQDHPELFERVVECQSPVFIFVEVTDDIVHVFATAPREAPTTRGFASILVQGLSGHTVDDVLAVPGDFPQEIGLTQAVSMLRIRGMTAMLARIKYQVRARLDQPVTPGP
ncbi:SufE family protein [Homoserinimonas sp. OAct 916]|uniref:SufE family protein n=1 Tax=Homoserinimonas sp. OAct 916 TaxID=2211450 RepID=UPI000DBE37B0|nr:SufE family protein [Homoserinimonas sp. OAct 916]